jgi:hypothetical protein
LKENDFHLGDGQGGMGAPETLPRPWGEGKFISLESSNQEQRIICHDRQLSLEWEKFQI